MPMDNDLELGKYAFEIMAEHAYETWMGEDKRDVPWNMLSIDIKKKWLEVILNITLIYEMTRPVEINKGLEVPNANGQ
jgi:hypothetical protein